MSTLHDEIGRIDEDVDGWFAQLRGNPAADRLFYTASALGEFGLLWVMLSLVRALRGRPGDARSALRAGCGCVIEFLLVNVVLKSLFRRRRPLAPVQHPLPFRQPLTSSFPSGHATAAFCAATLLAEGEPSAPLYYLAAAVVATSRIHVRIHHASDVAGGIVIGTILGRIGRTLVPLQAARKGARRT